MSEKSWIKIQDSLPEYGDTVKWMKKSKQVFTGEFFKSDYGEPLIHDPNHPVYLCLDDVTHWMKLPNPPKEKRKSYRRY